MDKLQCILIAINPKTDKLTHGKLYEVIRFHCGYETHELEYVTIKNDYGHVDTYPMEFFKNVELQKEHIDLIVNNRQIPKVFYTQETLERIILKMEQSKDIRLTWEVSKGFWFYPSEDDIEPIVENLLQTYKDRLKIVTYATEKYIRNQKENVSDVSCSDIDLLGDIALVKREKDRKWSEDNGLE